MQPLAERPPCRDTVVRRPFPFPTPYGFLSLADGYSLRPSRAESVMHDHRLRLGCMELQLTLISVVDSGSSSHDLFYYRIF